MAGVSDLKTHTIKHHVQVRFLGVPVSTFEGQPVNRVDNMAIFPGGYTRGLTRWERLRMWLKLPIYLKPPEPWMVELQRELAERETKAFLFGEDRAR